MANFLFWFQLAMAYGFGVPLIMNIIAGQTGGLTAATFAIYAAYFTLGFSLAISAWRGHRSRIRLQTVIIYANQILVSGTLLAVSFLAISWRRDDVFFTAAIAVLTLLTIVRYRGFADPIGRGWIAVWCKGVPQLWLAYTMLFVAHGASGLALISIVTGHLTATPRLLQVYLSGKADGWDRPTRGLLLGEAANVSTWWVVTLAWLYLI